MLRCRSIKIELSGPSSDLSLSYLILKCVSSSFRITNVVASQTPEQRPTGPPTARANNEQISDIFRVKRANNFRKEGTKMSDLQGGGGGETPFNRVRVPPPS